MLSDPRSAGKDGTVPVSLELTLLPWSWAKNCLGQGWKSKCDQRLKLMLCYNLFLFVDHKAGIWLLLKKDCCFELVRNLQIIASNMQNSVQ